MWCLVPQFKCVPDTHSSHCKSQFQSTFQLSKSRELICYRVQCSISVVSSPAPTSTTTVLDLEKLRLLTSESHATDRLWMYTGAVGSSTEANLGTPLLTETLLTSEDATIAAAAAEALALAKAALKLAKDAAKMMGSANLDEKPPNTQSEDNNIMINKAHLAEMGKVGFKDTLQLQDPLKEAEDLDPMLQELELLETQFSSDIAVRSNRQTERKAKRTRAAEKAAVNVVSVKSGSTSRKKRTAFQEIDHSDPLRFLRATTSSAKLLTATEEQELSAGIQDMMKLETLKEELSERFGCEPTFAQWAAAAGVDEKALRKRLSYGNLCKDKMIKSNIRLVVSIAKNYQGVGLSFQDLVQEGCRGLVRGTEKFDASKGFKFSTYAHWWIKQAIRKSLSDRSRTIRLPFHMVDATYRVKEAKKQLFKENGRQPNNEEVAEATGLSMKKLQTVLLTPKAPRSLDQKIGFNLDLKPSDVIADPEAITSEEKLMKEFMKKDLEKVLGTLNPREKQVIRWRFGLDDGRMKTLQEIGELMGVSRERIRQIESCAFRKLKNKKRTKHLQQYLVC